MNRVTIKDVARKTGVSAVTVHKVLTKPDHRISEKTTQRILEAVKELGYIPNRIAQAISRKPMTIAVSFTDLYPEVYDHVYRGLESAFDIYKDFNVSAAYFRYGSSGHRSKNAALEAILENDQITAAIITPPFCNEENIKLMKALRQKLKALVLLMTNETGFSVDGYIASNYRVIGQMASQVLHMNIPGKARAAIMVPNRNLAHKQCIQGFCSGGLFETPPLIYEFQFDMNLLERQVSHLLSNHPEVAGIFVTTFHASKICRYLKKIGATGRFTMVGLDLYEELVEYLEDGSMKATIFQNQELQAQKSLENLVNFLLNNGKIPYSSQYITPQLIMKSNLECYMEREPFLKEGQAICITSLENMKTPL